MKKRFLVLITTLMCLLLVACTDEEIVKNDESELMEEQPDELVEFTEQDELMRLSELPEESLKYYQKLYIADPDAAYSAEEWTINGVLNFPFSLEDELSNGVSSSFARYYIPQKALKNASTKELLDVSKRYWLSRYWLYDFPSYYLGYLTSIFNASDELMQRKDLAEVILEVYESEKFLLISEIENERIEKQEAKDRQDGIVLEEIILATDIAFEQMDDELRQRTIIAVTEKMHEREEDIYFCEVDFCGFFAYVREMQEYHEGSLWYDYIHKYYPDNEEVTKYLMNAELHSD